MSRVPSHSKDHRHGVMQETVLLLTGTAQQDAALEQRTFPDLHFVLRAPGVSAREVAGDVDAIITHAPVRIPDPPKEFARCRIVVRAGVGVDLVDLAAWGRRGVPVCNVPDYGTTEVADHAIALMLALTRGTATYHDDLRQDRGWSHEAAPLVRRLHGAVFGVLGLGRIGHETARRTAAFGMRVVFFGPHHEQETGYERVASLPALMARSDVVSVHAPLTEATRGLLGPAAFAAAKPGLILVNTARGAIVDLDALTEALRSGRIGGAALDVLPQEPPDPHHPLIAAWRAGEPWLRGRLTLSPHAAFYSAASQEDLCRKSVQTALAWLREGRLQNCVNARMLHQGAA